MDRPSETPSNDQGNSSRDQHRDYRPSSTFSSRTRVTSTAELGLNEFSSLLEAAQRIASIPVALDSGSWLDEEQPDPVIRRSSGTEGFRTRVPLTRQYSGRPHIPGEDSGSEDEESLQPEPEPATMAGQRRAASEQIGEIHYDREAHQARQQLERAAARLRLGRDPSQGWSHRRDELPANTTIATARAHASEHYATTGPSPVRDTFYDWAPEPQDTTQPQGRSSSVRRWRPTERLQDYANSHARRPSGNETIDHNRMPSTIDFDNMQNWGRSPTLPRLPIESGDHNDIVDRVERALQEYRAAARILHPRQDIPALQPDAPHTLAADSRSVPSRPPLANPAAQGMRDSLNMLQDVVSREAQAATRDDGLASTSNRPWRNETLRHRVHEHRRRFVSTLFDRESDHLASGPLFDAPSDNRETSDNLDTDRWRANTRRMLEKARRNDARAKSKEFKQAEAALRYLAQLRQEDMDDVRAWTLASELRLHNQSLQETLQKNLPISVDSLPKPMFCSWLEPGMSWTGTQSAEHESEDAKESHSRRVTEAVRRARERQDRVDFATRQNESFRARMRQGRDPLERALIPNSGQDALSVARNSMQLLEDAERNLSSMLEDSERLLRENERLSQENAEQLARNPEPLRQGGERLARLRTPTRNELDTQPPQQESTRAEDRWNVKVTLHEVDWHKMTLTGTMTASHTPNLQLHGPEKLGAETSMDSFFTGEIVDFANYGLDTTIPTNRDERPTVAFSSRRKVLQDDYKVGGPETDLTYWAGIGPFKERIESALAEKLREHEQLARHTESDKLMVDAPGTANASTIISPPMSRRNAYDPDKIEPLPPANNETSEVSLPTIYTEDEKYKIKMSTMHDLLTNTRWLKENINAQGWILMRWKERCFVAPGTEPNPEPNRPWIPGRNSPDEVDTAFGRGHLNYADLYRRRQDARTNPRIYTTNAAERDEIRGNSNNSATGNASGSDAPRQLTWTPSHSLSISGFYYVALHRVTGRIEALYYDCGSAPFQTLKMGPATCHAQLATSQGDAMDVDEQGLAQKPVPAMPGGLRTNFNVVEWR
ncbi:hypothetical protein LTR70_007523 [Exophiala xenobiotica]|uniref:Uncharacterized protein n=1 Tax=Lithohypha guttulata TaxID=1690604 RepID=A0ABR0K3Z4_9EURO|nr:hypothetical protein LTR24_007113 [Lithohypha guttulata]KAK5313682.1 hypothetical protein LTR70_007523 [Exophiala xenobiotica]